jgi:hypothetical protein
MRTFFAAAAFAAICTVGGTASARADSGFSLGLGEHFVFQNTAGAVGTMTDFSATYDVGPHLPVVPIRAALQFDYASGGGSARFTGGGIGARLTTPLYAGLGVGIYNVNRPATSATGVGSDIVLGSELFGIPGGSRLDLEAAFKQLPVANGLNLTGATVGLRLRF